MASTPIIEWTKSLLRNRFWLPLLIMLTVFIVYIPALFNHFVNWDDMWHIQNPVIHELNVKNIKQIFSDYDTFDMYMPLAEFSWAVDYAIGKAHPFIYHFNNVLLHVANTGLIFLLIRLLTGSLGLAGVAALLFGVAPVNVESVAWMSGRKDVLYVFFYLLATISYIAYAKGKRPVFYFFCLVAFILSLFTKGAAVVLPLLMLLIDGLQRRKADMLMLTEKMPFFILSLGFGLLNVYAVHYNPSYIKLTFPFWEKLIYAAAAYIQYFFKTLIPLGLSCYYPYPPKNLGFPIHYWFYLLMSLGLAYLMFILWKRQRLLSFALLFFTVHIIFLLQIISNSNLLMGDHYIYLSSAGLFLIAAIFLRMLIQRFPVHRLSLLLGLGIYVLFLLLFMQARILVWRNTITVWTDVINNYPRTPLAYTARAKEFLTINRPREAINDLLMTMSLDPKDTAPILMLGTVHERMNDLPKALHYYTEYLKTFSHPLQYYRDQVPTGKYDLGKATRFNEMAQAVYNHAGVLVRLHQYEDAIADYDRFLEVLPNGADAVANKGYCQYSLKRLDQAQETYTQAIALYEKTQNKNSAAISYYMRAMCALENKQRRKAFADLERSAGMGFRNATDALGKYFPEDAR